MIWSLYLYLAPLALAAVALLAFAARRSAQLMTPSRTRTLDELAFLAAVLVLGIAVVYGNFFLGTSSFAYQDLGSDTAHQYVPYYLNLLDSVRQGTLGLWNFDYGLGTSFMSYQSWTLDPFNLVLIPLGLALGDSRLALVLVFIQALKILICGFLFDHILTHYCELPVSRILGSALFAFCGYLMLWGQHYWLGSVIVMAAVVTLAVELMLERWSVPRFALLGASVAVTVMMSTYSGFMVMLYAATYAALRTVSVKDCRGFMDWLRAFAPLAVPVVCGLLVSCLTVVPYATLLLGESSRVTGSAEGASTASKMLGYLTGFVPLRWIPAILSRLLGDGLIVTMSDFPDALVPATESIDVVNTYEFIQLGFGCGVILLLGQFAHWSARELKHREQVLIAVAAMLCLLYSFNCFLPALSNVFVNPKYRSAFALAFPACIAMAVGFEKRVVSGQVALAPLAACGALTVVILAYSLANAQDGRMESAMYLCMTALLIALMYAAAKKPGLRKIAVVGVLAVAAASSVVDAFFVTNNRVWANSENFPAQTANEGSEETEQALAWISEQNDGFVRVEKLYLDWTRLSDSLVQGYAGVSSYNSTLDSDVIDFYRELWPNALVGGAAYQEFANDPGHQALLQQLGVKYLLAREDLGWDWVTLEATFGSTRVYRVTGTRSVLNVRAGAIAESDLEGLDAESKEQMLAACAVVPDGVAAELASADTQDVPETTEVIIGENGRPTADDPGTPQLELSGSSRISGTFKALANDSVACLAVPHTNGWVVKVDGQEVDTYRANYGFIGFTVSEGEHTIEAYYEAPNAKVGAAIAACGLVGGIAACAFTSRRRA